jgi:hypothetical protein
MKIREFYLKDKYQAKKNKGRINQPLFYYNKQAIVTTFCFSQGNHFLCRAINKIPANNKEVPAKKRPITISIQSFIKLIPNRIIAAINNNKIVINFCFIRAI